VAEGNKVVGVQVKDVICGGPSRVMVLVAETPPRVAVNVTSSSDEAGVEETLKDAEVVPEATVTDAGTDRSELLLFSETTFPLPIAVVDKETVQAAADPPSRVAGEQSTADTPIGAALRVNWTEEPFQLAVSTAVLFAGAGFTWALKLALDIPGDAVTVAGTVTSGPPVRAIETDSDPICLLRVTVQLIVDPGERAPELHVRDCKAGGADSVTLVVTDELPTVTVMLAVWSEEIVPTRNAIAPVVLPG